MGQSGQKDKLIQCYRRKVIAGISVVEILVGLAIAGIVAFSLYELLNNQQRSYIMQDDVSEMQQNMRVAVERIFRDIAMAGFGKATPADNTINGEDLSAWYTGGCPVSTGSTLHILGALAPADGTISTMSLSGPITITLNQTASDVAKRFNVSPNNKSDISIGGRETARITAINSNVLTVVPLSPTTSLTAQSAGTDVYVLRHITYSTGVIGNIPVLRINDHRGASEQQFCQDIVGISVSTHGNKVEVALQGRSKRTDPITGNYITSTISTTVALRNP
jgi:Tfp pilus assembly protein PilW